MTHLLSKRLEGLDTSLKTNKLRGYIRSSSFQMALLFTILCGISSVILGYFGYYFNKGHFISVTESVLTSEIRHATYHQSKSDMILALNEAQDTTFILLDKNNHKIAGSLDHLPQNIDLLSEGTLTFSQGETIYASKLHTFKDGSRLFIGADITDMVHDYQRMKWLSIISIILMSLVIFTSYLISHFVVSRTNKIAQTAKDIMHTGDLSRRIEVGSDWDDLSYMASVLNDLLHRVEELMSGIKNVSNNIAHDLKLPLTRLRNNLEEMKQAMDFGDKNVCEDVIIEADHLLATFNALLRIARIETEKQKSAFKTVYLNHIITDVFEFYEPLAQEKRIHLHCDLEEIKIWGDRDLLFQACANLVDNALKFTPANGAVTLTLKEKSDGLIILSVKDTGIGVKQADHKKIFDRFYRVEESRNKPGNGLGLSLVSAIISLHEGKIETKNKNPGFEVKISF